MMRAECGFHQCPASMPYIILNKLRGVINMLFTWLFIVIATNDDVYDKNLNTVDDLEKYYKNATIKALPEFYRVPILWYTWMSCRNHMTPLPNPVTVYRQEQPNCLGKLQLDRHIDIITFPFVFTLLKTAFLWHFTPKISTLQQCYHNGIQWEARMKILLPSLLEVLVKYITAFVA